MSMCSPSISSLQQNIADTYNGPTVIYSLQVSGNSFCCPNVVAGVGYTSGPANYIIVNGVQVDLGYVAYVENSCSYSPVGCYKGFNAPCNVSLSGNITFTEDGQYTITYFAGYIENGQLVITDKQDKTYQVLGVGTTTPPPSKYKYSVKIKASSTNIVRGQSVTITGAITPATFNLTNPNLQGTLNIYNPQSNTSTNINFNVNTDGTFSVKIPSDDLLLGTNIVSATITGNDPNGNQFSVTSNYVTINVSSSSTTSSTYSVIIETSSTNIVQGQSVTINGAITPTSFNSSNPNLQGTLNIYNLQSDSSTNINFNVNTDGTFSVEIPSDDLLSGTNIVSATITGNDPNGNQFSATSNIIAINVSSSFTTTIQSFISNLLQFVKNHALIISIGTASIITAVALYEVYKNRE